MFERIRSWQMALGIALFTLVLYLPFQWNEFVSLDDGLLITKNAAVQELSLRSLRHIFTSYDPELYVPLTLFSYQITDAVVGLNPFWFHLGNLILHIGSAVLLFYCFLMLSERRSVAFLAAVLFAIHPIHTEAVLWAAARKDVLSAFFFFASLLCYVKKQPVDRASPSFFKDIWYVSSLAFFLLGLLSKASIITLPFVLLLVDWYRRRQIGWHLLMEKIPYFFLCVVFGIIALGGKSSNLESSGFMLNALLAAKSTLFYLRMLFVPAGFSVVYPEGSAVTLADVSFVLYLMGAGILIALAILARKRIPAISFGIALFLILLVPNYTNFWKNGFLFFASDRYAYLPSIGIFFIVAWAFSRWLGKNRISPMAATVALCIIMVGLGARTYAQGATWKDSEALYRNVVRLYPGSALAWNNLGDVLVKQGRTDEAVPMFQKAIAIDPQMMSAHLNMGEVHAKRVETEQAIDSFMRAIEIVEKKEHLNLDELGPYYFLGRYYDDLGRRDEALVHFRRAVERAPIFAEPHHNLGVMLQKYGKQDEAIAEFERAIALDPLYIASLYHLASVYAEKGRIQEAATLLENVVSLQPTYEKAAQHLANIRLLLSR